MAFPSLTAAQDAKLTQAFNQAKAVYDPNHHAVAAFAQGYDLVKAIISVKADGTPVYTDAQLNALNLSTWSLAGVDTSGWKPAAGVEPAAWVFLAGVSDVNRGMTVNGDPSAFSDFTREYTKAEYILRYGEGAKSDSELNAAVQAASNGIAFNILRDVTTNNTLPDIRAIALNDAQAAAAELFDPDGSHPEQIGGWAGNTVLMPLGHTKSYGDNVLHQGDGQTYDIMAMLYSMNKASEAVGIVSTAIMTEQVLTDIYQAANPTIFSQIATAVSVAMAINATDNVLKDTYGLSLSDAAFKAYFDSETVKLGTFNDDNLGGTDDDDFIHGGDGEDSLSGGKGNDIIDGGKGNDTIDAGQGDATLAGGEGLDRYVFKEADFGPTVTEESSQIVINDSDGWFEVKVPNKGAAVGAYHYYGTAIYNGYWATELEKTLDTSVITTTSGSIDRGYYGIGHSDYQWYPGGDQFHVLDRVPFYYVSPTIGGGYALYVPPLDYGLKDFSGMYGVQFAKDVGYPAIWMNYPVYSDFHEPLIGAYLTVKFSGFTLDCINQFSFEELVSSGHIKFNMQTQIWTFDFRDIPNNGVPGLNLGGTSSSETLLGFDSNDTLSGEGGNDTLSGGSGNDSLLGGDGNDSILGEDGNDKLEGGAGTDTLIGGKGNDVYVYDNVDTIVEQSNEGIDTIQTVSTSLTISGNIENLRITGTANTSGTGNSGANLIEGGSGSNTLIGNGGNDTLIGNGGNDVLNGGDGADSLSGGDGYDHLYGGAGDTLKGGAMDDIYDLSSASVVIVEAADGGRDEVHTTFSYTLGANLEALSIDGTLGYQGKGNDGNNFIIDSDGNDSLWGEKGNDVFSGRPGDDRYYYDLGDGDDEIYYNFLEGGSSGDYYGTDRIVFGANIAIGDLSFYKMDDFMFISIKGQGSIRCQINTGNDMDLLQFSNGSTLNLHTLTTYTDYSSMLMGSNDDDGFLIGSSGDDTVQGLAGGADYMDGKGGVDLVSYSLSNKGVEIHLDASAQIAAANVGSHAEGDTIVGFEGVEGSAWNDALFGNSASNKVIGNAGVDALSGGAGQDTLSGGAGNDIFRYVSLTESTSTSRDVIADFTHGQDKIELYDLGFTSIQGGAASGTVLGFVKSGGITTISGNGLSIQLTGEIDLGMSDFIFSKHPNSIPIPSNVAWTDKSVTAQSAFSYTFTTSSFNDADGDPLSYTAEQFDGSALPSWLQFTSSTRTFTGTPSNADAGEIIVKVTASDSLGGSSWQVFHLDVNGTGGGNTPTAGADSLTGDDGNNTIQGMGGNDTIYGGNGNDSIEGEADNDQLRGEAGNDTLKGGAGNDLLIGNAGADSLYGDNTTSDNGADSFRYFTRSDSTTTAQDKIFLFNPGDGDRIDLTGLGFSDLRQGNGTGSILGWDFQGTSTKNITLNSDSFSISVGYENNISSVSLADFIGVGWGYAAPAASLTGGTGNDTLIDTAGHNSGIVGGIGNDVLDGGDGDDTLDGGVGIDTLKGRAGVDIYFYDELTDSTNSARDLILNWDSDDKIDVRFLGYTGFESVAGATAHDSILSYSKNTAGDYTLVHNSNGFEIKIDGVQNLTANNFIFSTGAGFTDENYTGTIGNDTHTGAQGNDSMVGGDGADSLSGGVGADTLVGGTGNDTLIGGLGSDQLDGGADYDRLEGGDGNDLLIGGSGEDYMKGGSGSDTFLFYFATPSHSTPLHADYIVDFNDAEDKIRIKDLGYTHLVASAAPTGNALGYYESGGDGWLKGTLNDGFLLQLNGPHTLTGGTGGNVEFIN